MTTRKITNGPTHNISLPPLSFDQHTLSISYKNVAFFGSSLVSSPLLVVSYFRFSVNFTYYIKFFNQEKMFAAHAFATLLALATPFFALADVIPSEPGPGDSYNAGATCHTTWLGDPNSTTVWKNMAIELMSGSNLAMVHITSTYLKSLITIFFLI